MVRSHSEASRSSAVVGLDLTASIPRIPASNSVIDVTTAMTPTCRSRRIVRMNALAPATVGSMISRLTVRFNVPIRVLASWMVSAGRLEKPASASTWPSHKRKPRSGSTISTVLKEYAQSRRPF